MGLTLTAFIPPGMIKPHAGGSIPQGYLGCDGSAISRIVYAALFSAIGTTFGLGDGSLTFNLPDLRGRTPIGDGTGSGLTTRNRGDSFGSESHILSTSNLPTHTHGTGTLSASSTDLTNHTHTGTSGTSNQSLNHGHSYNDSGHDHDGLRFAAAFAAAGAGGGDVSVSLNGADGRSNKTAVRATGISINATDLSGHTHSMTTGNANSSLSHSHTISGSTDSGGFSNSSITHSPPSLCVKYIIRY